MICDKCKGKGWILVVVSDDYEYDEICPNCEGGGIINEIDN